MKSLILAASFVTLAAVAPAMAADNATSCRTLGQQTAEALSSASGDATEAKTEIRMGMQACNFGLFKNGADHYRKALSLLGK
jgi:hypothetical protein